MKLVRTVLFDVNMNPSKLEQFALFHLRDFHFFVFLRDLLAGLKRAGLSWKKVMSRISVRQSREQIIKGRKLKALTVDRTLRFLSIAY